MVMVKMELLLRQCASEVIQVHSVSPVKLERLNTTTARLSAKPVSTNLLIHTTIRLLKVISLVRINAMRAWRPPI